MCGAWESLVETLVRPVVPAREPWHRGRARPAAAPRPLGAVASRPVERLPVGIGEVDRVLGGGLVPGALVLLGGEPGIGKSTLVMEIAAGGGTAARDDGPAVLYATGEESAEQLHLRAARLGPRRRRGRRTGIQVLGGDLARHPWSPPRRRLGPGCSSSTRSRR